MEESQSELHPLLQNDDIDSTPVYPIIHMVRQDMVITLSSQVIRNEKDTPLTYDALTSPDLTYTLLKPLEDKYSNIQRKGNYSVVFCFLLNRINFLRDRNLVTSSLSRSRAALCEIMASRLLRLYGDNTLELAFVTTTSWRVYAGADEQQLKQTFEELDLDDAEDHVGNAIEIAIIGRAKRFIKSSACQRVIDSIWSGKCVYQAQSSHSIISDTYKQTPIHFYDPHKAPLLDHYRLKVPAVRSVLEYINFLVLFVLFVMTLELSELDRLNWAEIAFMIYALGFSLEKVAAMQEHGLKVFFTGTWNGFDLALITIFVSYASTRLYGIRYDVPWARASGIDCLAIAACLIFPRLAFVTLKNNLMVLSLRAMILQFLALMLIAVFCFAGFLYALWTLSKTESNYSVGDIFWWMADLWFGLDATGFMLSSTFHPFFGPILMVSYACLSNTLLLTVLVSILSHTFSSISEDAAAEAMFRRAVLTIEGVKADYLFSYQPPINLIALVLMLPASWILSPRWFHKDLKVNVFMIRLTSFPILLSIAYYERQAKHIHASTFSETVSATAERVIETLPRSVKRLTFFEGLFAGKASDIDVIFDIDEELTNINDASALDTRDVESTISAKLSSPSMRRRISHGTSRRVSTQSGRAMSDMPSSSSVHSQNPKDGQDEGSSPSQATQQMRSRLASVLQRGAEAASNFTSPLAQIYQPLVVDDDLVDEQAPGPASPTQPNFLSYGPVTRRRLSSMHRFPPMAPTDMQRRLNSSRGQLSQTFGDTMLEESPRSSHNMVHEETEREEQSPPVPETASQAVDQEGASGAIPQVASRLIRIEERQKRLEELIMQLSQDIRLRKE
ncbi:hypothetical protein EW145_g4818 [Phellinidium pouzarii]|uniref:Uncharacterized protein n=1 Tax=Phellinidium pouzarii TaxID=167371 RepID=A0A4S4L255_9AGAM|nr:hypothetical protein EW145_g4818 [Phellinidium pouzarii]